MQIDDLKEECFSLLKKIPFGKITNYKIIAEEMGLKSYRLIGKIIGSNQYIPAIPCRRVIKSNSDISGYAHGVEEKIKILAEEGVFTKDNKVLNYQKILHHFS